MVINQSSVDIGYVQKELQETLVGAKIDQIYQYDTKTFAIRFHKSGFGKLELLILLPHCVYITKQRPAAPKKQLSMSSYFRKSIKGMFVEEIFQPGFTRVLCFKLAFKDVFKYVFIELFDKGNIIVCTKQEESYVIEMPAEIQKWNNRYINKEQVYIPQSKLFLNEYSLKDLQNICCKSEESISKVLATQFGLGGLYAQLVCDTAQIDPQKPLLPNQLPQLQNALNYIITQSINPKLVFGSDTSKPKAIIPILGESIYGSYSQPFDEFCTQTVGQKKEDAKLKKYLAEVKRIESMISHQKKTQKKLVNSAKEHKMIGEKIQESYTQLTPLLQNVFENEKSSEKDLLDKYSQQGLIKIDKKEKIITVELP